MVWEARDLGFPTSCAIIGKTEEPLSVLLDVENHEKLWFWNAVLILILRSPYLIENFWIPEQRMPLSTDHHEEVAGCC